MRYVARLRMHLAQAALRQPGARIADVAGRFGYDSEAAFSRAFKRYRRRVARRRAAQWFSRGDAQAITVTTMR